MSFSSREERGVRVPVKKKLDNSLLVIIKGGMDELYRAVRRSKGQYSVTIPLKFAMKGGFDTCKLVGISQAKNGNLKIRRIDFGKSGKERV